MKSIRMLMMKKVSAIEFTTNKNGTFDPSITTSDSSIATWKVTGETPQVTNTPSFSLTGDDETVTLTIADFTKITNFDISSQNIKGTIDISLLTLCTSFILDTNSLLTEVTNPVNSATIERYEVHLCNITGVLDLSDFSNLSGIVRGYSNSLLTSITNPISSGTINVYEFYSCDLTGTLDVSDLSGLQSEFEVNDNSNLTSIDFPTSSGLFSRIHCYSCNLTGIIDISNLTGLGGIVRFYSNPNLTGLTLPTSSTNISHFEVYSCDLTGTLDVSGLSGLGGEFEVWNNPNLTSITLPVASNNFNLFYAYSCGLTGTLDLSNITLNNSSQIRLQLNSGLTDVTFPASSANIINIWIYSTGIGVLNWSALSGTVTKIDIQDNVFTNAESDENIVLIDDNINLTTTLDIAGTNGALTDGSGTGFDGLAAKDQLIVEGVSVTYN